MSQKKSLKDKRRAKRKDKRLKDKQTKFFARLDKIFSSTNAEPIIYWGYNREFSSNGLPCERSDEGLVCSVTEVSEVNLATLQEQGLDVCPKQWIVSAVNGSIIHGPFATREQAFDYGRAEFGAVSYLSDTVFD